MASCPLDAARDVAVWRGPGEVSRAAPLGSVAAGRSIDVVQDIGG